MRLAVVAALLLGAAACQQPAAPVRVERTVVLMGTTATFAADAADRAAALAWLERMVQVVEATEAELSTWRDDSTLSGLNRQPPGEPLSVPPALCDLLGRLEGWREATAGAFDPAIGSLIDAWGLRAAGRRPDAAALGAARARAGWPLLGFDREACTVTRLADATLDAGAFGKGEALDRVRAAERDHPGAWLIDFGGQVAVSGGAAGTAWPVALAHPAHRDRPVAELLLAGGSLATSGGSERTLTLGSSDRIGHILDPRSGAPVALAVVGRRLASERLHRRRPFNRALRDGTGRRTRLGGGARLRRLLHRARRGIGPRHVPDHPGLRAALSPIAW